MSVSKRPFGKTAGGETVTEYTITNERGASVSILDYGATVRSVLVPDRDGKLVDVVLGYDSVEEYEKNTCYFGATIGRNANRIEGSEFSISGRKYTLEANEGRNQLHGGFHGFDKRMWSASCMDNAVNFFRTSPDGEEGFPGKVDVCVMFRLTAGNALEINYWAESDQDTVCNLTNHSYFNLSGSGEILDHRLQIFADSFTENTPECLPSGRVVPVSGTPMDFSQPKNIGGGISADYEQIRLFKGFDHNFILRGDFSMKCAAILKSPKTGIELSVYTDRPGMQLYTGNSIYNHSGKSGVPYGPYSALCLETQIYPNSLRYSHFPTSILRKGEFFRSVTIYEFSALK